MVSLVTFPWLPFLFLKIVGSINNVFLLFLRKGIKSINCLLILVMIFYLEEKSNNQ